MDGFMRPSLGWLFWVVQARVPLWWNECRMPWRKIAAIKYSAEQASNLSNMGIMDIVGQQCIV